MDGHERPEATGRNASPSDARAHSDGYRAGDDRYRAGDGGAHSDGYRAGDDRYRAGGGGAPSDGYRAGGLIRTGQLCGPGYAVPVLLPAAVARFAGF